MSGRVTSLEVAAKAGVSQSAVSRVFTPGASASRKTIEKVRRAAEELGYRPNSLARAMVSGKSRIIGLIVAYLDNYFYPEALEKLSNALQEKGYHVLIFMASQSAGNIDDVVQEILDYQVDGIIAASVALGSDLSKRCREAGVPMVLFNRSQDDEKLSAVTSNNLAGGRKVAEFLLAGGHQRIAYLAGWEGASTQRDREAGFRAGLAESGRTIYARQVGNYRLEQARDATLALFADKGEDERPDALFVANDHMGFAAMDVLRFELGFSLPEQVSVVGYDDVPMSAWPAYNLTTVRQPANQMVRHTVDLLLRMIDEPNTPANQVQIDGPLVVRGSARLPEGWSS